MDNPILCFVLDKSYSMGFPITKKTLETEFVSKGVAQLSKKKNFSVLNKIDGMQNKTMWQGLCEIVDIISKGLICDESNVYEDIMAVTFCGYSEVLLTPSPAVSDTCIFLNENLANTQLGPATAIYTALKDTIEQAKNANRAVHVILVTDGEDNSSTSDDKKYCREFLEEMGENGQIKVGIVAILPEKQHTAMLQDLEMNLGVERKDYVQAAYVDRDKLSPTGFIKSIMNMFKWLQSKGQVSKDTMKSKLKDKKTISSITSKLRSNKKVSGFASEFKSKLKKN